MSIPMCHPRSNGCFVFTGRIPVPDDCFELIPFCAQKERFYFSDGIWHTRRLHAFTGQKRCLSDQRQDARAFVSITFRKSRSHFGAWHLSKTSSLAHWEPRTKTNEISRLIRRLQQLGKLQATSRVKCHVVRNSFPKIV